jgi:putative ABC transport system substrate-binding protein
MGLILPGSAEDGAAMKEALFWERLRALGWEEGRNLQVERRFAQGRKDDFPAFMEEMVRRKVDIIVTTSTPAALSAKRATTSIPIVVHSMGDPVGTGLVSSLGHPGGNLTGLSTQLGEGIPGKWLELLQEIVPRLSTVAVLSSPDNPIWRTVENKINEAAGTRGLKIVILRASAAGQIEEVLHRAHLQVQAVVVIPDPLFVQHREYLATAIAKETLAGHL